MTDGIATVKLKEIKSYPATGMMDDYIFEYQPKSLKPLIHPNAKKLFGSTNIFPIPGMLMKKLIGIGYITKVKK